MHLGGFGRESQSRVPLICGPEIDNLVTTEHGLVEIWHFFDTETEPLE